MLSYMFLFPPRFTKNLSPDKINLSTLKGEGHLSNLELDEEVLQNMLDLPTWLAVTRVYCNKAAIRVRPYWLIQPGCEAYLTWWSDSFVTVPQFSFKAKTTILFTNNADPFLFLLYALDEMSSGRFIKINTTSNSALNVLAPGIWTGCW